jgi:hypothetical protein
VAKNENETEIAINPIKLKNANLEKLRSSSSVLKEEKIFRRL